MTLSLAPLNPPNYYCGSASSSTAAADDDDDDENNDDYNDEVTQRLSETSTIPSTSGPSESIQSDHIKYLNSIKLSPSDSHQLSITLHLRPPCVAP